MDEIRSASCAMLTPQDISEVLGCHPQWIRDTARQHPELVGYPFTFSGNRMKIPRMGFINWYEGR